ncbi:hypothetical protein [Flavobacterium sp.]|jgi:hypothetical protein|uniref:hypothetical protein n=1 Tax=Flavobacterium sp. TaxID=239 RepID=UPI002A802744|nr:hypothetical protein [Flavobacterium sp.]
MLYDITYRNDKVTKEINDFIGNPYSFLKAIQMGGTGSHRMMIDEVSAHFKNIVNTVSDINYGSIEIRPNGIIFHVSKGLQRFAWLIPYYKLVIFKSITLSIHADGKFIKFKDNQFTRKNSAFISKLIDLKSKKTSDACY